MADLIPLKIKRKPYFYDAQIKRYLLQIMANFAGMQVRTGKQRDGEHRYMNVPVIYGSYSRVVGYHLSGGNENTALPLPFISVDMEGLRQSDEYRREPQHQEKIYVRQRVQNNNNEELSKDQYKLMMVERHMAVPYELVVGVSIWCSNEDTSMQLIEQIGTVFNSGMDIELSNSPLDWFFLTTLEFDGEFRKKRVGADLGGGSGEDDYYVIDMTFSAIVHLSAPAKVGEAKLIESVHVNILDLNEERDFDTMENLENFVITADDD